MTPLALLLGTGAVTAAVDLVSKWLVFRAWPLHHTRPVIPGFLNLFPTRNYGGVFGIGQGKTWVFIIFTIVVIGVVLWVYRNLGRHYRVTSVALGLLLGGAAGNLWDRVCYGSVRDFIDFHAGNLRWFPFNPADAFICIGAAILFVHALRHPGEPPVEPDPAKANRA